MARTRRVGRRVDDTIDNGFMSALKKRVNKKYGDDTILSSDEETKLYSQVTGYIDTQCFGLNLAMHLPGIPYGRVSCIRGDFMSGKSTLAQHLMAECQKQGGMAVYIDTEYAFDENRAGNIGMSLDESRFIMPQVDTIEETIGVIDEVIAVAKEEQDNGSERPVIIVWDSVGATSTKAELEGAVGDARPGMHARLLSAALRRITPSIARYKIALVIVNQEKEKIQMFGPAQAGAKTMTAEKPIMFHSTIVLRPQYIKTLTDSAKRPIGIRVKCLVRKNKLAAPFSPVEFVISFKNGIDNNASLLSVAEQHKVVKKQGSWYQYDGDKFQARDFATVLKEHPEIMERLEEIRIADAKGAPVKADSDTDDEDEWVSAVESSDEDEDEDDDDD